MAIRHRVEVQMRKRSTVPPTPEPIPTGDQYTLDYMATKIRIVLHEIEVDPWHEIKSGPAKAIILKLKALDLEIEQLTGTPATDHEGYS